MQSYDRTITQWLVTVLVAANLWVALQHGGAHDTLAIELPDLKNLFVFITVTLLPTVGALLLWTRWMIPALSILSITFMASAAFGIYHHYILISPDNVAHLPHGSAEHHHEFLLSAGWLAVLQGLAALICTLLLGYWIGHLLQESGSETTNAEQTQ